MKRDAEGKLIAWKNDQQWMRNIPLYACATYFTD